MTRLTLCLNGEWQFESDSGLVTGDLAGTLTLPFCPDPSFRASATAILYRRF